MEYPNFFKKKQVKAQRDDCRIKIKRGADGSKTIDFKGNCTPNQIEMARENIKSELDN
jgi:hypothetical protein